jgi:hypothetical protein
MYFCPKCSYLFDISKLTSTINLDDTRIIIEKIPEALALFEKNQNLSKYKASFTKDEINKNKKYQKMKDEEKIKFNQLFEELFSSGAEFKCNNCNFSKQITETTLLYQLNMENKVIKISSLEENELMCKDQTLPHTHDYTCKNTSCLTHKEPNRKDAIFYKDNTSYKVNYVCTLCYYNW